MKSDAKKNNLQAFSLTEIETILSTMHTGVVRLDEKYAINYANQVFCEIAGYNKDDLSNKKFSALLKPVQPADSAPDIFSFNNQQSEEPLVIGLQKQNGNTVICTLKINHLYTENTGSSIIVLVEDVDKRITGEKVLRERLLRYNTQEKHIDEKEIAYRRQLVRAVMDTQESERRKLAEELHDNVNQLLGVVKLYIEHSITNDNIREGLLKKSNEYIDKAIAELRNLSKNLAPPLLKELGLEHSVNSLADVISGVQDINITVDMIDFDEEGLKESHMLMIYRIVQEQLNNITKHSGAKNADITLQKIDSKVQLTIIDDGIGVDLTTDNTEGMGLRNIRNRIELYQGTVEMVTSPDNGFMLKVEFEI